MISVLLVDDHPLFIEALRSRITRSSDIQIASLAYNGKEAVAQARLYRPDVVVMDISMPVMDGLEATRQIYTHGLETRVLIISAYDYPGYIKRALQVGALGYVLKDTVGNEILAAIHALHMGKRYFSLKILSLAAPYLTSDADDSLPS